MHLSLFRKKYLAKNIGNQWNKFDTARDKDIPEPKGIKLLADIPYAPSVDSKDSTSNLTDIIYPDANMIDAYPVIVNVHGGGWFYGNKQIYSTYAKFLASQGFAVINFNYRLAPIHTYPAAFVDVCKLMTFISSHAGEYHLDLNRLYMVGDSAGAQLAAQYSIAATSSEYRKLIAEIAQDNLPIPSKIALNCGLYEFDETRKQFNAACYLPKKMTKEQAESAFRMLNYLNADFPASFIMASVNDILMPQSQMLHEKLSTLNIPHIYREYGQNSPQDSHVFHLNLRSSEGQKCNADEIAFFQQ